MGLKPKPNRHRVVAGTSELGKNTIKHSKNYNLQGSIEYRSKNDIMETRESPPKIVDNRVKITQKRVDKILNSNLSNVSFSADIEVNNRISDYGQTKIVRPPVGRAKVSKILIGKQKTDSDLDLIDTLIHEELEARIAVRSYDNEFYAKLDKASDEERHKYINKVIERFMRGRFE